MAKTPLEIEIQEFSSKKLKEIIEEQSNAYSENFIDFAKDELIRRGETFAYDIDLRKKVKELNDADLRIMIERDRENYHLEYLELAINEYLSRGFKNEPGFDDELGTSETIKIVESRYTALRTFSTIYFFAGCISFIGIINALSHLGDKKMPGILIVLYILICLLAGITCLAIAEAIKVFLAIEENTRKSNT